VIYFGYGTPKDQPCNVCGAPVLHFEMEFAGSAGKSTWWQAKPHNAPCGAPCMGGGVVPRVREEVPPGENALGHAHRKDKCGVPECAGGTVGK
jgi:hypothetical protein